MRRKRVIERIWRPWRDVGECRGRPTGWWRGVAEGTVARGEVYAKMMEELYERAWMKKCKEKVEKERERGVRRGWERRRREGEAEVNDGNMNASRGPQGNDKYHGRRVGIPSLGGRMVDVHSNPQIPQIERAVLMVIDISPVDNAAA